jgi:hypothetical protein
MEVELLYYTWFVGVPMIVGIMAIERKEKRRSIGSSSP